MEFQQLKGFLAVARHQSFSKAAVTTFRTQPAISLQIQSLEHELGVQLFDRLGGRKVMLTDEGKIFFDLVSPLVDDYDSLTIRFHEMRGQELEGMVRIATHTSVMVYLLPEIIKAFKKKHPDCELSIVNRSREDILKMVQDGEVDIGITSLKAVPDSINYTVFAEFKRLLIGPKTHPLARKPQVSLSDIAAYPLLLSPKGSNTREIVDQVFHAHGLAYKLAMEATGRLAVKEYVGLGLGISIINAFYIAKEDTKKFFIKDMSRLFGVAQRAVITRKKRYLSKKAREFIDLIIARRNNVVADPIGQEGT